MTLSPALHLARAPVAPAATCHRGSAVAGAFAFCVCPSLSSPSNGDLVHAPPPGSTRRRFDFVLDPSTEGAYLLPVQEAMNVPPTLPLHVLGTEVNLVPSDEGISTLAEWQRRTSAPSVRSHRLFH